jgi:GNAT superfamily N-acetyltransferase
MISWYGWFRFDINLTALLPQCRKAPVNPKSAPAPPGLTKLSPRPGSSPSLPAMSRLLRSATPADVPLILAFIRDLAAYEKLSHEVVATADTLRRTLFGDTPAAHVVIAEEDGHAAGFALYFFNYSTFLAQPGLYLEDLFVKPEFRGRGTGKALLLHLAKIANARGCGRMEWAVLDWNEPAKGFYRKLGAVPLDDWRVMRLPGRELGKFA